MTWFSPEVLAKLCPFITDLLFYSNFLLRPKLLVRTCHQPVEYTPYDRHYSTNDPNSVPPAYCIFIAFDYFTSHLWRDESGEVGHCIANAKELSGVARR